jgi:chorismate mutase
VEIQLNNQNLRGIRGAIDVPANNSKEILEAAKELLQTIMHRNLLEKDQIAAAIFSMTVDLDAAFPAKAAREMGWKHVPLFCTNEVSVPGSLPHCIRVLLLVNTGKSAQEIIHVYLRGAVVLREDLQNEDE